MILPVLPAPAGLRKDAWTPQRGVLRSAPILARPVQAGLRRIGKILPNVREELRRSFYTVKTTYGIKNEP